MIRALRIAATAALIAKSGLIAVAQSPPGMSNCTVESQFGQLHPYLQQCVTGHSVEYAYRRQVGVVTYKRDAVHTFTAAGLQGQPVPCAVQAPQQTQQHVYTERVTERYGLEGSIAGKGQAAVEAGIGFLVEATGKVGIEAGFVITGRWNRERTTETQQTWSYVRICCTSQTFLLFETSSKVQGKVIEDQAWVWELEADPCWGGTATTTCPNAAFFPGEAQKASGSEDEYTYESVCSPNAGTPGSCCWCELCP